MNIQKLRGVVAAVLVIAIPVVGLATNTQLGALCSFGAGAIASICPLGALETLAAAKSPMPQTAICIGVTVALVIGFGKAACAWACPIPWLQRFFAGRKHTKKDPDTGSIADEWDIKADLGKGCSACGGSSHHTSPCVLKSIGGKRDGIHLDSRHAVLAGSIASAAVFGFPVFCLICPIGLTFATIVGLWNLLAFNETTVGMLVFPAILIVEVVLLRKWCHRICPVSALMGLVACGNKTLRPRVDESKCLRAQGIDCHVCVESCPEKLDPHSGFIPECSKCHKCADSCPAHAISFTKRKNLASR